MREPEYSDTTEFMQWARENKRRADDVVKAAKVLLNFNVGYFDQPEQEEMDLMGAITHYEERD